MSDTHSYSTTKPLNEDMDAQRWAREFNEVLHKAHGLYADEGLLIGWFANAIMCGHDNAKRSTPEHGEAIELLRETVRQNEYELREYLDKGIGTETERGKWLLRSRSLVERHDATESRS